MWVPGFNIREGEGGRSKVGEAQDHIIWAETQMVQIMESNKVRWEFKDPLQCSLLIGTKQNPLSNQSTTEGLEMRNTYMSELPGDRLLCLEERVEAWAGRWTSQNDLNFWPGWQVPLPSFLWGKKIPSGPPVSFQLLFDRCWFSKACMIRSVISELLRINRQRVLLSSELIPIWHTVITTIEGEPCTQHHVEGFTQMIPVNPHTIWGC